MALMDIEGKERIKIDGNNLNEFARSIRGIHKMELDQMMVDYITDNRLEFKECEAIRMFVKYLKEQ